MRARNITIRPEISSRLGYECGQQPPRASTLIPSRQWWQPDHHAARRPALLARNRIKAAIRAWFEAQGFAEIEAAALQVSPGNETHLHGFATAIRTTDGRSAPLYLHTSPELAAKKLLAAGER